MSQPHIRIRTAADVLAVVPAMLGFYPTESLVAMLMEDTPEGSRIICTARWDLPQDQRTASALDQLLSRGNRAALVVYSLDQHAARTVLADLLRNTDPDRILTALVSGPEGWTHLEPATPDSVLWTNPYTTASAEVAAAITAAGLTAHPRTREDLRESVSAPDAGGIRLWENAYVAQQVPETPDRAQAWAMATEVTETVKAYMAQPFTLTTEEAAFLVARVQPLAARDAAWMIMERPAGALHLELWREVAALSPDVPAVLPVLGLLGFAAWIKGETVLSNLAIERADTIPGGDTYPMLGLLRQTVQGAVPPQMWDQFRQGLR